MAPPAGTLALLCITIADTGPTSPRLAPNATPKRWSGSRPIRQCPKPPPLMPSLQPPPISTKPSSNHSLRRLSQASTRPSLLVFTNWLPSSATPLFHTATRLPTTHRPQYPLPPPLLQGWPLAHTLQPRKTPAAADAALLPSPHRPSLSPRFASCPPHCPCHRLCLHRAHPPHHCHRLYLLRADPPRHCHPGLRVPAPVPALVPRRLARPTTPSRVTP